MDRSIVRLDLWKYFFLNKRKKIFFNFFDLTMISFSRTGVQQDFSPDSNLLVDFIEMKTLSSIRRPPLPLKYRIQQEQILLSFTRLTQFLFPLRILSKAWLDNFWKITVESHYLKWWIIAKYTARDSFLLQQRRSLWYKIIQNLG